MMTSHARFLGFLSAFALLVLGGTAACDDDDNPLGDGDDVAQVIIEFGDDTLTVGGTVQLTVTVIDEEGDTLSSQTVAFTSSNTAVASVSSTGLVTALTVGSTNITATVDNVSDTIAVVACEQVEDDPCAEVVHV